VISTQSPPPRPFSVVPPPRNCPSLSSTPPQTVDISWLLPRMGGAALARVLRVAGRPSSSHRRHPFFLVAISSSPSHRCCLPRRRQCRRRRRRYCCRRHRRRVPLPHRRCRHHRHHCRWRRCLRCRRHHRHHRSSSSCLSCSLAVNPRNSTKASQGGIAHGMGMERIPLDLRRVADGVARTTSCQRCRPVRNIMVLSPGGWRKGTLRYSVYIPSLNKEKEY
jgi:hypothetical protein